MRRAPTLILALAVLAACSSYSSQRVRQYNAAVEEGYKQVTILLDANKIDADAGAVAIASLDLASKEIDRWWAGVQSGAPREVQTRILQIITDALAEATAIMARKETP